MRPEGRGVFRDAAKRPDTHRNEPQRKQWPCKYARVQSYTLNGENPKREPQRSHRATNCKRPKKRTFKKIRRRPERNGGDLLQMFGPKQSHHTTQKRPQEPQRAPKRSGVHFTENGEKWQNGACERLQSHRAKADTLRSVPEIPEPIRSDSLEADKRNLLGTDPTQDGREPAEITGKEPEAAEA